jgi:heme/copper-type cytochrome/quinol oxidase subunit 3
MWVPLGMEHIRVYRKPLVATMVLVTSGYTANYAFYMVMIGNYESAYWYAWFTSIWAWLFLFIQFIEYNTLLTSISDTVFGSIFFLITGFHGIHVLIGTIFITIQYDRIAIGEVGSYGYVGCFCATIYWHFVDCIWLVVYSVMYVSMYWEYLLEC